MTQSVRDERAAASALRAEPHPAFERDGAQL
jgi:hypothetical protein